MSRWWVLRQDQLRAIDLSGVCFAPEGLNPMTDGEIVAENKIRQKTYIVVAGQKSHISIFMFFFVF